MKRKKKHKEQQRSLAQCKQDIVEMLEQRFSRAGAARLVTLRYEEGYHWQDEDYYMLMSQHWINGMNMAGYPGRRALQCIMDTDWEEGAGAPVHRAVMELGADALLMARLWVYGTATVERLDLTRGMEQLAELLMGSPTPEGGRQNG